MERMYYLLHKAATGKRLNKQDKSDASELFTKMHKILVTRKNPPGFLLASGQKATGATGRIALNAYFLLLGRLALGKQYVKKDKRMRYWNMFLGFHIMRSYFGGWTQKGIYCCSTCTLSVFPLYCTDVFDYFSSEECKNNVVKAYTEKLPPFTGNFKKKYAAWSMRFGENY